ncbi:MAG TPA: hypothetical protein VGK99_16465 [Acidobacteriota bacterium]
MNRIFLLALLSMVALAPPVIEPSELELGPPVSCGPSVTAPAARPAASLLQLERGRRESQVKPLLLRREVRPSLERQMRKKFMNLAQRTAAPAEIQTVN